MAYRSPWPRLIPDAPRTAPRPTTALAVRPSGAAAPAPFHLEVGTPRPTAPAPTLLDKAYPYLRTGAAALGAWHGYSRNQSVAWALAWAAAGGIAPAVTTGIAVAQGLGRPERRTPKGNP